MLQQAHDQALGWWFAVGLLLHLLAYLCAAPPLGGSTGILGGLSPPQGLASVPLCLTSSSVV